MSSMIIDFDHLVVSILDNRSAVDVRNIERCEINLSDAGPDTIDA